MPFKPGGAIDATVAPTTALETSPIVQVLWTGGWDSTYRVLELVVERGATVQPWYFRDPERASAVQETATMEAIRERMQRDFPGAATRLLPSKEVDVRAVPPAPVLSAMHSRLHIGSQYDWLARFLEHSGLDEFELGAVRGGGHMYRLLWPEVERSEGAVGPTYRLRERVSNPDLELFRRFSFPILHLSKPEIRERAEQAGYLDIMQLTWFCFAPRGGRPCGMCAPCMVALHAGMGWRIPLSRQLRPRLRLLKKVLVTRGR